jgi:3-oxoacyl-[acyl-carrier protein] reductase
MEPNRTFLITGASSGIGRRLIAELRKERCCIFAHYHAADPSVLLDAPGPGKVVPLKADLSQKDSVERLISQVKEACGCPDALVHLPGGKLKYERFPEGQWDALSNELELQVGSAISICQAFLPLMVKKQVKGRVVFMLSSVTLGMPPKNLLTYCVSKYALLGLMRAMASEYAGTNVTINAVSPSMVETNFLSAVPAKLIEIAASKHPMGRNASPEDVIPALAFLLSEGSQYITGVNLPVSGGQSV